MKRIVLAVITCLSLLVALPAVSAAHSSDHHAGRDHRPGARDRGGDRHRDRERRDRLEHFPAQPPGTADAVQSFRNGVLTITLAGGSSASGTVTGDTRVSCEAMDQESSSHDGGSGSGDNGDHGDRHDENNNPSCVAMLQLPGTTVRDAELHTSRGEVAWEEIELGL